MIHISRRQLARYAADELLAQRPLPALAKQLAAVLIEYGREKEADMLIDDIAVELENRGLSIFATAVSAEPLPAVLKAELLSSLKAVARTDQASVDERIDKSIIGGLYLETATASWDSTVNRQLQDLRKRL